MLSFVLGGQFDVGTLPRSIAVGDFTGTTQPGVVVADSGGNLVSSFAYKNGNFTPVGRFGVGPDPRFIAVGDFNSDGKPDLAVANAYPDHHGTISVLLGNGNGTFREGGTFAVGQEPRFIAVGHFNGDGAPDLAVADYFSDTVSILLGKGDGTFEPAVAVPVGDGPRSVAVGDFTGDGVPDIATADHGGQTVTLLTGSGDGVFHRTGSFFAGTAPTIMVAKDFNRDGITDLAVANGDESNLQVLLGTGKGTFENTGVVYQPARGSRYMVAGDLNNDGNSDLVVANSTSSSLSIYFGNGDGTFRADPPIGLPIGYQVSSIALADLSHAGRLDILVVNKLQGTMMVLVNKPGDKSPGAAGKAGAPASPASPAPDAAVPGFLAVPPAASVPSNQPAPPDDGRRPGVGDTTLPVAAPTPSPAPEGLLTAIAGGGHSEETDIPSVDPVEDRQRGGPRPVDFEESDPARTGVGGSEVFAEFDADWLDAWVDDLWRGRLGGWPAVADEAAPSPRPGPGVPAALCDRPGPAEPPAPVAGGAPPVAVLVMALGWLARWQRRGAAPASLLQGAAAPASLLQGAAAPVPAGRVVEGGRPRKRATRLRWISTVPE